MAGRGSGTMIQFGKLVVAGDAPLDEIKRILDEVLRDHGYPESDVASVKKEAVTDEVFDDEMKKLDEELLKEAEYREKPPWERGR